MLERDYDRTRVHAEKQSIVWEIRSELKRKFKGKHPRMAILKKLSDLKRRNLERIREIRDRKCPEVPLPSVRRRSWTGEIKVVSSEEEEGDQAGPSQQEPEAPTTLPEVGEEVEVAESGPSQKPDSTHPAPDEEEEVVTSPRQKVLIQLQKKIAQLQAQHDAGMQDMRRWLQDMRRQLRKMEVLHGKKMKEISDLHEVLKKLP
ncbi:uncharacterized protein LOC122939456 [Bufo gargarizans]|uniref:uncharacterized protein LOC122939456 n=1 Tax=Bufo gargarizans TaxID=30331 RepID=UPI001CF499DE|nr:uncharacterized protein LOC122939456 [Bufo gargarizans]